MSVLTEDLDIASACRTHGCDCFFNPQFPSRANYDSGSARIADFVFQSDLFMRNESLLVINWQGDEPLLCPESIHKMVYLATKNFRSDVITLACPWSSDDDLSDPEQVKVVCDDSGNALFFSRLPLKNSFRHVGCYAYRKPGLRVFLSPVKSPLAAAENLEQMKILEQGGRIKVLVWPTSLPQGVDTYEQYRRFVERTRSGP